MPSSRTRRSPACRLVAAVLILLMAGLQWDLLQGAAWVGMLVKYARTTDLQTAIEQTFDGEHPCAMCKAIRSARAGEKTAPPATLSTVAGAPAWTAILSESLDAPPAPSFVAVPFAGFPPTFVTRIQRPPVPPPRPAA